MPTPSLEGKCRLCAECDEDRGRTLRAFLGFRRAALLGHGEVMRYTRRFQRGLTLALSASNLVLARCFRIDHRETLPSLHLLIGDYRPPSWAIVCEPRDQDCNPGLGSQLEPRISLSRCFPTRAAVRYWRRLALLRRWRPSSVASPRGVPGRGGMVHRVLWR